MPPLPPTSKVLKVEVIGSGRGSTFANIFHVQYGGAAPTVAQLLTFANDFASAYHTNLMALMDPQYSITEVIATDLTSNTGNRAVRSVSFAGSASGIAPLAANVALALSWAIGIRYRGGHPRTYLPGQFGDNMLNSRNWTTTWEGTAGTDAASFLNAVNALSEPFGPITLGTVNYWVYGAHPKQMRTAGQFVPYQGATAHSRIDSQRRRLGKEVI